MALNTHQIDEYLLGRLQGDALEELEGRMAQDPAFAQEVQQRRTLMEKVDAYGDFEVKAQLKELHKKEMKRKTQRKRFMLLGFAAAVVLLLACAYWFWQSSQPQQPKVLFANYYQPYSQIRLTVRDNQSDQTLAEAARLYKAEQFKQALPLFETLYTQDTTQSNIRLALAICEMEASNYSSAFRHLQPLVNTQDFDPYQQQAYWYSALIYLQQEDVAAAKQLLELILQDQQSDFYHIAKELLSRL